ncbi:MAG: hypothetical protein LC775_07780 [Acidobacteria bacterium]|nr:hypothetical protein [Acidobacteriota bacterium]
MTYEGNAKFIRNAMVGIVVVVLLGLVGCSKPKDEADVPGALDPSDVIEIVVEEKALTIPEELRKVFDALRTASFALVDEEGRLRVFSAKGEPRNLCGAGEDNRNGSRTCKQEVPSQDLMIMLRVLSGDPPAFGGCGKCTDAAGNLRNCKLVSNMRPCSTAQFICKTNCK